MRTVCGLDVHKDSVFVCIMNGNRKKFEARYGVLTPELEALRQLLLGHAPVQPAHLRPEQGKVYKLAKLDALLQRCNIRISKYLSSTDSRSYKEVVRLLSEGVTSPGRLMEALHGRTVNRVGRETLKSALTGVVTETDIDLIEQYRPKEERHESESSGRPQNAHDRLARDEGRCPLP